MAMLKMRRFNIIESFKLFVITKPPLVTFVVCLICFFLSLFILLKYINSRDIPNPDLHDWNTFKESLSSLQFCIKPTYDEKDKDAIHSLNENKINELKKVSYTFDVNLFIEFVDTLSHISNISHLYGQIQGYQIGLQDHYLSQEILYISFDIIDVEKVENEFKKQPRTEFCNRNNLINAKNCKEIRIKACANVISTRNVFPKTRAPKVCKVNEHSEIKPHKFDAYKETPDLPHHFWCGSSKDSIRAKIENKPDPSLTAMLTSADIVIISRHIRYCLFLLSIVTTLVIIVQIMKHHRAKNGIAYQQVDQI